MNRPKLRRTSLVAAATVAAGLAVATVAVPADAGPTVGIQPVRTILTGSSPMGATIANNGTIYAADGDIEVWSRTSDGFPDIVKTFTGTNTSEQISLHPSAGLAYVHNTSYVDIIDPAQADGPAVPVRTIDGANTTLDTPIAVAFTKDGSLWVLDEAPQFRLLRFAPGADGNVAPVRTISGPKTGLISSLGLGNYGVAALPGNGVAVAPSSIDPQVLVFTGSQNGNVKPARKITVPTPDPTWVSIGVAADSKGRIYFGTGTLNGTAWGNFDVFGPKANGDAKPLLRLGGSSQRMGIPMMPAVAPNGTVLVEDARVLGLGGGGILLSTKVFKPLFTKPGKVKGLKAAKKGKNAVITWKAGANPSGTPVTYKVTIKKGKKTKLSKTTTARSLKVKRSALPKGKLKVTVVATNVGGKSGAANKTLKN